MTEGTLAYLKTEMARQHRSATVTLPRGLVVGMLAELLRLMDDPDHVTRIRRAQRLTASEG